MYKFRVKYTGYEWLLQRKVWFFFWETVEVTGDPDVMVDWLYDFEIDGSAS